MPKALIYCRVSSERQVREGSGLKSQRHLCMEYAKAHNYDVEKVFQEKGITGGNDFRKRKAMVALLQYLDDHSGENYVVIFDDLKRFARDTHFHLALRQELAQRNAVPKCPNFNFEDTPESNFIEVVLAAQGELERKQNTRQVKEKMKARLLAGYWPFRGPLGYKNKRVKYRGSILTPTKEAPIIREALLGFAKGRFKHIRDVKRFLNEKGIDRGETAIGDILRNILYAGYMEFPAWSIGMIKGNHKALVSLKTWRAIQDRLNKPTIRSYKSEDGEFPLRRKIKCAVCGRMMTGSFYHGRNSCYPFYTCHNSKCMAKPKYVRRNIVESAYEEVLKSIRIRDEVFECLEIKARSEWEKRHGIFQYQREEEETIDDLENRLEKLMDAAIKTSSERLRKRYETEIRELEIEIESLSNGSNEAMDGPDFEVAFSEFSKVIRTPLEYWRNADLIAKHKLHDLVFSGLASYSEKSGFRTAELSHGIYQLSRFYGSDFTMVDSDKIPFDPILDWILRFEVMQT